MQATLIQEFDDKYTVRAIGDAITDCQTKLHEILEKEIQIQSGAYGFTKGYKKGQSPFGDCFMEVELEHLIEDALPVRYYIVTVK